ncbi:MAG: rhodanese-like domain-containing protein [Candidatus Moranbacteria bacterium]|nr:rhodanese-like domain-containing protein [Candidatus Moranbacteria bacterium]
MQKTLNQKKDNVQVILVGFALIVLVVGIFFVKAHFDAGNSKTGNGPADGIKAKDIDLSKIGKISLDSLRSKLISDRNLVVIDLRNPDDFRSEHIIDSKNIPIESFASFIPSLDSKKYYVVVDASGDLQNIGEIASLASDNGVGNLSFLDGGFSAWKNGMNPTINDGDPMSFSDQAKVSYVKADDLKAWMATNPNLLLIDVRSNQEFALEHLKGAINITADDLESKRRQIPLGRKIVVYDSDSLAAYKAAVRLNDLGVINAYSLAEGLNVWKQKGYETVK